MGKSLYYFLFLIWLCYLIVSSILLFTRGFLLTRVVHTNSSTCTPFSEIMCASREDFSISRSDKEVCSQDEKLFSFLKDNKITADVCLPPTARIVLLIVDALRYDFITFDETNKDPLPFQNRIPVISRLIKDHPDHTRVYKFIADPPTTTMQRIKGLTTGSLPTFIDAGSNFATSEINEDNIIDQMLHNNYKVVFMGDDTWNGLYPDRFIRNYPYPSFNVWDLDTVDNGVRTQLHQEINNTDWNLLIGHVLGVDHCGHRYGPNHPEMERKLGEINGLIEYIVEEIDETTMLFVIGDHGMTSTGDHGGESEDEVTAGFFLYSKQPLLNLGEKRDFIKQVDIVPTLATILGVPVPFQNLGILVLNCLPASVASLNIGSWRLALYYLWLNVNQVLNYITEYSKGANTFSQETLNTLHQRFSVLKAKLVSTDSEDNFLHISKNLMEFIWDIRKMCEDIWIQFDSFSMTRGLLLLFMTVFFTFIIGDGIPCQRISEIFTGSFMVFSYTVLFSVTACVLTLYYLEFIDNLLSVIFFATGVASQVILAVLVIQNWEIISLTWYSKANTERVSNLICRIVLIFNICGLFSNSYVIEESFVLLFLLVTIILIGAIGIKSSNKFDIKYKNNVVSVLKWSKLKLLLLATVIAMSVRISMYFWHCREEQQWCFANIHEVSSITAKLESTKLQWSIAVISLALFIFSTKEWLRNCGNLNGYSLTITIGKFVPTAIVVCIAGFWGLKQVPSNKGQLNSLKSLNILALTTYALILLGILVTIIKPLCIYIIPGQDSTSSTHSVPAIFKNIKSSLYEKDKVKDEIPVVCGLGTAYSSVYVIIGVYLSLLFALLLNEVIAPVTVIMFMTATFILITNSVLRVEKAKSVGELFDIPNISILIWIILAEYFFYASGHQPTFPNISWEAAFIGTSGIFTNNIILGTLIIINTFCSYILMGVLLPLLLIAPFTVLVMIPSLLGKKINDLQLDMIRGEVMLFEQDRLTFSSTFVLSCKYISGHGIRVLASMLAATIHCRHLMVWKIFAPKFIFESVGMFITLVSVMTGFLILIRINRSVERFIIKLNKLS